MKSIETLAPTSLLSSNDLSTSRPPDLTAARRAYIGLLIFLGTEVMFFAGLISAFLVFRNSVIEWPPPGQPRLPIRLTAMNTAVLLLSALTIHLAVRSAHDPHDDSDRRPRSLPEGAARRQDPAPMHRWLGATLVCGVLFLLGQGSEWARLISHGLTMSSSVYGSIFYTLIGAHAIHVLAAVIVLGVVIVRALRGHYTPGDHEGLSLCRVYWLFVVGLWPILYLLVYLT